MRRLALLALVLALFAWCAVGMALAWRMRSFDSTIRPVDSAFRRNDSLMVTIGGQTRYVPRAWLNCKRGK